MGKALNGIKKNPDEVASRVRIGVLGACTVLAIMIGYEPVYALFSTGRSDYYSHILLIPFVTAYFLFEKRKEIQKLAEYGPVDGAIVAGLGLITCLSAFWFQVLLGSNDYASTTVLGCILLCWGAFLFTFGRKAFVASRFGLLFICFAIPIPEALLDRLIYVLQVGSTEVTQWLFELTGTDYVRDGFVYQLTGINIEVAKECSSIRSSLALIITGVVAGHLFLKSGWRKVVLLIVLIPINIIKNGIRITTVSLLAIHVDRNFITDSFLHHSGGFLFYLPALGMMGAMVMWLRKGDTKGKVANIEEGKQEQSLTRMRAE